MLNKEISVAIIGLGYVGHPLAINFGRLVKTIGFDTSQKKRHPFEYLLFIVIVLLLNKVFFFRSRLVIFYPNGLGGC